MGSFRKLLTFATLAGALAASTAGAQQSIEELRAKYRLPLPSGIDNELGRFPRGAPGTSTGSPSAFGASWNDAFVGMGFQAPVRYSPGGDVDGSASAGFGLGNGNEIVGVELAFNFLSTVRSGIGNRMGIAAKIHKVLQNNWGVAVGVNGVMLQPNKDDKNSVFGVVTKVFQLQNGYAKSFTGSIGVGNGGFQTAGPLNSGKNGLGVFASAALRVNEMASVIVDWPGQDLNVGVSFVPFHSLPLVISPAIVDITGSSNAGVSTTGGFAKKTGPRFTLGVGFAFRLTAPAAATNGPAAAPTYDPEATRIANAAAAAEEERRRTATAAANAAVAAQAARDEEARRAAAAEAARLAAQRRAADEIARPNTSAIDAVRATLAATIYYDFDKDDIRDDQKNTLDSKVPILLANPAVKLRLAGHTDERGSDEYNQALGQRRAASAKRYLVARGIAENRIETTSFGEDRPVDAGHDEAAWAKNRRTEFEVTAGGETIRPPQR